MVVVGFSIAALGMFAGMLGAFLLFADQEPRAGIAFTVIVLACVAAMVVLSVHG